MELTRTHTGIGACRQTPAAAQMILFGATLTAARQTDTAAHSGGYLESSVSTPRLTRTSAA